MATYSNDLRLKEINTGDEDGTWGTSTNTNLSLIADAFGYGTKQLAADADETFTMPDASADGTRALVLKITSAVSLTATRTVTLGPNTVSKVWLIENATSGSQTITIKQGSGATVNIASGEKAFVYTDGAGAGAAVFNANPTETSAGTVTSVAVSGGTTGLTTSGGPITSSGTITLAGTLAVANGGTGATTDSGARANLNVEPGVDVLAYDANLQSFVTAFTLPTVDGTNGQVITTNGSGTLSFTSSSGISLTSLSVGAEGTPSGNGALSYNNSTGVFTYTPPTASGISAIPTSGIGTTVLAYDANLQSFVTTFTLPTSDGVNGQVLTTNGSGTLSFTTVSSGGGISLSDLSVGAEGTPSGNGALGYNNSTGVFTYTPPTASGIGAVATGDIGSTVQAFNAKLTDVSNAAVTDGNFLVGNGSNFVAESGATARASLGLAIGVDVQPYDANTAVYDATTANFTGTLQNGGSNVLVDSDINSTVLAYDSNLQSFVNTFTLPTVDGSSGQILTTNGAGTLSFSTASGGTGTVTSVGFSTSLSGLSVSGSPITTSGTISLSGTLGIASGGTGATTASGVRANLDLEPGVDVQPYDADLSTIAGLAKTDGNFIVGNGTQWVAESGATARASLGLVIGVDVQPYSANTVLSDAGSTTFSGTVNLTTLQLNSSTVTSTAAELNLLDGVTASTAELNYLDIATLGVQQASKALTANASNVVKFVGEQHTTYALAASGSQALEPDNGLFQYATLTGTTTFTDAFSEGQEIILGLAIGGTFTINWPTVVWVTATGTAPSISNGDILYIILYKVNGGLVGTYNQYDV